MTSKLARRHKKSLRLTETDDDYDTAKLDEIFSPKKINYEIFQQKGETMDQFTTQLRKLGANYEFHDLDKELKSAIIQSCQSKRLRRYALGEEALTLNALFSKARSLKASERQATSMERSLQDDLVQNVCSKNVTGSGSQTSETECRKCGLIWPHKMGLCPAKWQTCCKCGKPNKFAWMCLSKKKSKTITATESSWQSHAFAKYQLKRVMHQAVVTMNTYTVLTLSAKMPTVPVQVNGTWLLTQVHPLTFWMRLLSTKSTVRAQYSCSLLQNACLHTDQNAFLGKFEAMIAFKSTYIIHVLPGDNGSLLGYKTATSLGFTWWQWVTIRLQNCDQPWCNRFPHQQWQLKMPKRKCLIEQYPNLFKGIGNLKGVEVIYTSTKKYLLLPNRQGGFPFTSASKSRKSLNTWKHKVSLKMWKAPLHGCPLSDYSKKEWRRQTVLTCEWQTVP